MLLTARHSLSAAHSSSDQLRSFKHLLLGEANEADADVVESQDHRGNQLEQEPPSASSRLEIGGKPIPK